MSFSQRMETHKQTSHTKPPSDMSLSQRMDTSQTPLNRPPSGALWQQKLATSVENLVEGIEKTLDDWETAAETCRKFYREEEEESLNALINAGREAVESLQSHDQEYGSALAGITSLQDDWSNALRRRTGDLQELDKRHKALGESIERLQHDLVQLVEQKTNAQQTLKEYQSDLLSTNTQLEKARQANTDLNVSIKRKESEQAEMTRSLKNRIEEVHKKERDLHARDDVQNKRQAHLDSGIQAHNDRESELRKLENKNLAESSNNRRDRTALCEALDSLRSVAGLLGTNEDPEKDILQESRDLAVAVQTQLSSLEDNLRKERETCTEHMQNVNYWRNANTQSSRQVNTLKNDVTSKEDAIRQHLQTIAQRDSEIDEYVLNVDALGRDNQRLRNEADNLDHVLKECAGDVERLKSRVRELEDSSEASQQQCSTTMQQREDIQTKYNNLQKENGELKVSAKRDSDSRQQEMIEAQALQTSTASEAAAKQQRITELEAEVQQLASNMARQTASSQETLEKVERSLTTERQRVSQLEGDKKALQEEVTGLATAHGKEQEIASDLQHVNGEIRTQLSELANEVEKKNQQALDWESRLANVNKTLAAEKATSSRLRSERNLSQKQVKELTIQIGEDQRQIQNLKALQQGQASRDENYRKQSTDHESLKMEFREMNKAKKGLEEERDKLRKELHEVTGYAKDWEAIEARLDEFKKDQKDFINKSNEIFSRILKDHQPAGSLETALASLQNMVDHMASEKEVTTKTFRVLFPTQPVPNGGTDILKTVLHGVEELVEDKAGLVEERDSLDTTLSQLNDAFARLDKNYKVGCENMKTKDEQEVQLKTKLEEAAKNQESMRVSKSSTEKDLQDSWEQCSDLDKMVQKLQRQVSQLGQDKDRLQEHYQSARNDVTTAEQSGDDWKAKYEDSLKKSQVDAHDIAELKQKLHDAVEDKKSMQSKEQIHQTALATVVQGSDELNKKFETSLRTMEDKARENAQMKQLLQKVEREKLALQVEYNAMETRLSTAVRESREFEKKFQTSLKTMEDKARENAQMRQLVDSAEHEKQDLQGKYHETKARLATAVQERINWQDNFKSSESKLQAELDRTAHLKQQLDNTELETRRLQEEHDHMTDRLATAVQDCNEWKNKYETSRNDLPEQTGGDAELHQKLATANQEIERAQSTSRSSHNLYNTVRQECNELKARLKSSEAGSQNLQHQLSDLRSERDRYSNELGSAVKELAASKTQIEDLQVRYDQMGGLSGDGSQTDLSRHGKEANKRSAPRRSEQQLEQQNSNNTTAEQDSAQEDIRQRKRPKTDRAAAMPSRTKTGGIGGPSSQTDVINREEEPWISIDQFRTSTFKYGDLPLALFDRVRQQMDLWDSKKGTNSATGHWTEGAKGRAKGQVKCAHHFAQHDGSDMRLGYACGKCDERRLVCVGLLQGQVQLRPLPPANRSEASKGDMEYWVRNPE
ncbi:MAG: hypothetical protein L6R42_000523 [Xanthoria sp. 1 TBL-2021]|nr:MAG: hypothetical protein L6R42_000523 [Xanthoria sp. 1 TBL-2021]